MITYTPTIRTEQRIIPVDLPEPLDDGVYRRMVDAGWTLTETRSDGKQTKFVFTRQGRPMAGDVERRIVGPREARSS